MSDSTGNNPFSQFPQFSPMAGYQIFESMMNLMRMPTGFATGFGQAPQPLGLVPEIVAPLMNVEELDRRITDLRAVEQWLKLNLSMLQSTIQAFEVQRSTLATLRAFGAFAQASMTPPEPDERNPQAARESAGAQQDAKPAGGAWQSDDDEGGDEQRASPTAAMDPFAFARAFYDAATGTMTGAGAGEGADANTGKDAGAGEARSAGEDAGAGADTARGDASRAAAEDAPLRDEPAHGAARDDAAHGGAAGASATGATGTGAFPPGVALDASSWWNMLQSQFNQIAAIAMAPQPAPGASVSSDDIQEAVGQTAADGRTRKRANGAAGAAGARATRATRGKGAGAPSGTPRAKQASGPAASGARAVPKTASQTAAKRGAVASDAAPRTRKSAVASPSANASGARSTPKSPVTTSTPRAVSHAAPKRSPSATSTARARRDEPTDE